MITDRANFCDQRDDIAAYLDGELSPKGELSLEMHLADCSTCSEELNLQKQLLLGLESGLRDGLDIEVPKDFAKVVVANAESTVAGLRRPRERSNALFICGALSLFVLLCFGVSAGATLFLDQVTAVASFVGHLVYDLFIGVVVILRTGASHFRSDVISAFVVAGATGAVLWFSRKLFARRLRV